MVKKIILATIFLILVFLPISFLEINAPVQTSSALALVEGYNRVYLAEIEGKIKAGTYQYLKRVIRLAQEGKSDYLIIKLDTPGGLLKPTKEIVDLILASPVKIIVFVHQEGGWAYSAGTFILMAADFAVVHPRASLGAAQPQMPNGEAMEVNQKMIEGMASWVRSLAKINQRNTEIAEEFVRDNLTLTGQEAKEIGIIDETAVNLDELFLKLNIKEPEIRVISFTLSERFFNFLSHPYLISLFLTIGGLAIVISIRTGEFEVSGIVGIVTLLIGLWGFGVITFSFLGVGLILLGSLLLFMEIFIEPGFGIFGVGGAAAIVLGIFTFEAEPFFTAELWDPIRMIVLGAALAICIFFVIIGRGVAKSIKTKPQTGSESLIGLRVEVIKELSPRGRIQVKQETWSAESLNGETISKESKVEIVKIEGNTLYVKTLNSE